MSRPFQSDWLPPGWRPTKLRSFLTRRKRTKNPDIQLLSVNLPQGVVPRQEGDGRPAPSLDLDGYQEVRPNDLVMNQLGKPHGALGVSAHHGIISPAYFVAEISEEADPRFVHHLLRTRLYISEYERRGKYMPPSQFDISWEQFRDIPVALPPLEEQRVIADYLDTETARIDALISKKHRLLDVLAERRQAEIITAMATKHLTDHRPLRAYAEIQLGRQRTPAHDTGPNMTAYLRAANVQDGRLDLSDVKSMDFDASEQARFSLEAGDVLVTEGSGSLASIGATAVWNDELDGTVCFQNTLLRLRPRRSTHPRFLAWWCRYAYASGLFAGVATGANIFHLSADRVRSLPMTHVPLTVQRTIADHLDTEIGRIEAIINKERRVLDLLAERRQALITAMVTGEMPAPRAAA